MSTHITKGPVCFGLVGAGAIAHSYLQAFQNCPEVQLVAVSDTNFAAAQSMAQKANCKAYSSHIAMADAERLDAVLVCTPPNTHPHISTDFIERRIAILCEKPLCKDVASARSMILAARSAGVMMTMASKFRYVDDVVKARQLVNSGAIGDVVLIENFFTSHVDMTQRWNSNPEISGGGVLIDNGTHSVDIMRYFLGPLAEIHVVEGKRSQHLPVDETVHVFLRSTSGILGTVDLSWSINKELESYLRIYGSAGTISVGWKESKYLMAGAKEWTVFGQGYNKVQAFSSQLQNFARALRGSEPLVVTLEDALASVQVVEAGYASLRDAKWFVIPLAPSREAERPELEKRIQ
jgi:predicted dehydrogenase